ncbi:MAG: glycosyltransferase [Chitinivibrionales bacterium]|nr:glycosyltransferase [Chitinivibrionales bacterium]
MIGSKNTEVKKCLNILFLDHFNRHGGAQEYIIDVARYFSKRKKNCYLPKINIQTLHCAAEGLNQTNFSILSKSYKSVVFYIKFVVNIFQVNFFIRRKEISIVHCNSIPVLFLTLLKPNSTKNIFTCHDVSLSKIRLMVVERFSDYVISVSNYVKFYLYKNGISQNIETIYNGFYAIPSQSSKNKKGVLRFGIIGRIIPWKGHNLFLEAANIVLSKGFLAKFFVIGEAEEKTYLKELKLKYDRNYAIIFLPFKKQKYQLFRNIDVLVNASISPEPFGRTIVEAAMFGIPSIAPNIAGPSEIIEDGITGLLFDTGDAIALSNSIIRMIRDKSTIPKFGLAAKKNYNERFNIDLIGTRIEDIYDKTLNQ